MRIQNIRRKLHRRFYIADSLLDIHLKEVDGSVNSGCFTCGQLTARRAAYANAILIAGGRVKGYYPDEEDI